MNHIIPPSIRQPLTNNKSIEEPRSNSTRDIENPNASILNEISEKSLNIAQDFDLPPSENAVGNDTIEAAVMIGIRKRKMRKHKLRKLRKRMKFEWAKRHQRREMKKEKDFQAGLLAQIKEAEKFSAEEYVAQKLASASIAFPNGRRGVTK